MQTLKLTRGRYLMVLLAMCGLIASSVGILLNTGGLFFVPIARELGCETAAVNMTLTFCNLAFALAGMISALWINPKNFKLMIAVCTAVCAAATAGLSLCRSLITLYVLNGIRGFAGGLVGNVLATTVVGCWFRSDTGFISSLVLACSGLAGAVLNPALQAVINAVGWRGAYLTAAAVAVALNLPAILLPISFRPADQGLEPLQAAVPGKGAAPAARTGDSRSIAVVLLAGCLCSLASFVTALPQLFKSLALSRGMEETGVLMMTVVLIANTGGKFVFGSMTDHLGLKRSVLIYGTAIALGILTLLRTASSGLMLFSAALIGLSYAIPTVGMVMVCRELFSPERYSKIYPKISLCVTAANALAYPLLGVIYDVTHSYDGALILVLAVMLVTMAQTVLVYRLADREKAR